MCEKRYTDCMSQTVLKISAPTGEKKNNVKAIVPWCSAQRSQPLSHYRNLLYGRVRARLDLCLFSPLHGSKWRGSYSSSNQHLEIQALATLWIICFVRHYHQYISLSTCSSTSTPIDDLQVYAAFNPHWLVAKRKFSSCTAVLQCWTTLM